jgi:hypothetical protein
VNPFGEATPRGVVSRRCLLSQEGVVFQEIGGSIVMEDTISALVTSPDPSKGIFGGGPVIPVQIPVEKFSASLSDLVSKLRTATASLVAKADGWSLKELEVGLELTAEGGVSLIGTAKAGGTASLKLTLVHEK